MEGITTQELKARFERFATQWRCKQQADDRTNFILDQQNMINRLSIVPETLPSISNKDVHMPTSCKEGIDKDEVKYQGQGVKKDNKVKPGAGARSRRNAERLKNQLATSASKAAPPTRPAAANHDVHVC